MRCKLLHSGASSAQQNMALDVRLLDTLHYFENPIIHFYDWLQPSITYGYFTKPGPYLNLKNIQFHGIDMARRPTGGGITLHLSDMAFSILVPATHEGFSENVMENYAFVNTRVLEAITQFVGYQEQPILLTAQPSASDEHCEHFCMAHPTKYDVMLGGRKVGGGAQRRTKAGFLHQGTISLGLPDEKVLKELLLPGTCVSEAMKVNSCVLLEGACSENDVHAVKQELQRLIVAAFQ